MPTPGADLGDERQARTLARWLNEYTARLVPEHPGRFGFFATLTQHAALPGHRFPDS